MTLDVSAEVMKAYSVFGFLTHYFIDRDGIVCDRYYGPLSLELMRGRVESILGGY